MDKANAKIVVVDDDPSILRAFSKQIALMGHSTTTFEDPQQALRHITDVGADCLVLDLNMPGLSGLEIQDALKSLPDTTPAVFVSGAATVQSSVAAMRGGATNFLEKPVEFEDLQAAIEEALQRSRDGRRGLASRKDAERRIKELTPRQYSVFREVLTGAPNKVIARRLGIGERTVKAHRHAIMERLEAKNLAEVLSIGLALRLAREPEDDRNTARQSH